MDDTSLKDPYLDETSGCLHNKLNITHQEKLDKIEATFSLIRIVELERRPLQKKFDLAHLQATHKHLFQDIYAWAGEIRTVDMMKGETYFAPCSTINTESKLLFNASCA